jgi:hypothetical protein
MDKLVAFVDKKESWDEGLQSSVFAINTDVHTARKFSPFEVVFGFSDEPPDVTSECSLNALRFREKTSSLLQP